MPTCIAQYSEFSIMMVSNCDFYFNELVRFKYYAILHLASPHKTKRQDTVYMYMPTWVH